MSKMNRNVVTMLQTGFVLVTVTFDVLNAEQRRLLESMPDYRHSTQTYTYKVPEIWNVKRGDCLVVSVNGQFKVVTVVATDVKFDIHASYEYKPAVQKVDDTAYKAILEQEEKMKELIADAEKRKAQQEVVEAYKQLFPENTPARQAFDEAMKIGANAIQGIGHDK